MRPARFAPIAISLLAAAVATAAPAAEWRIDPEESVFAVLTHRAGLGASLAHDHLIVARGTTAVLDFDLANPEATRFTFEVPVLALDVDPAADRARWAPRLRELGVLDRELPEVDADDRAEVREAMLGPRQLAAEQFPTVSAELVALERRGGAAGARVALGWNATVRVSLHGKRVEKVVPVRWETKDGELTAEALGEYRFTEFGIEPYSAFLGAVKNADLFHILVEIVARPAAEPPPATGE